ncbi:MAG: hypothetical protein Q9157_004451 [Trypethelium eluteriae]
MRDAIWAEGALSGSQAEQVCGYATALCTQALHQEKYISHVHHRKFSPDFRDQASACVALFADVLIPNMAAACDPVQQAFESVSREFRSNLGDDELYQEILKSASIDEVYDATDKLQAEQAKKGHLRHLSKIGPFLEGLRGYADVIEVFMQAKPDVLALIWGPVKLILQWTSVLKQSFDAVVNTIADIGVLLPEFRDVAKLFDHNKHIQEVLILFFKDILDFYLIALKFFSLSRKTFLSCTITDKAKTLGLVVFTFLSYTLSSTTTALSIIHSLIFQLASNHEDLQAVLTQSSHEDLKRNIDSATRLLTTLAACAGPVYFIIDGLDEVEEVERGRFLKQLLCALGSCKDAKILVSSRLEADLENILEETATKLRVDHRNAEGIKAYVDAHTRVWFRERKFLPEAEMEIKNLLAPLPSTSKGMMQVQRAKTKAAYRNRHVPIRKDNFE